ncbi:MAG: short-chain dehydrogenase [Alphaproteobacteria bacterium]|nr:short-chain dehydrogenase [Alphaproteobacteria bacterium]
MDLEGLVTIITGGASGLGEATARRFAQGGARVVIADLHDEAGQAIATEIGGAFVRTDVTDEAQVKQLVDRAVELHGRLDCMINNAGVLGATGGVGAISGADWSRTLAILLDSVFFGMKHASNAIKAGGRGGSILSTTSVGGIAALAPHAYTTAKHGVVGLTRSVASELAGHRIRVNAVAPGQVATALTVAAYGGAEAMRDFARARSPMGLVVEPEDIAGAFAYLAGPAGRTITGQVLTVDAGLVDCRLPEAYYLNDRLGSAAAESSAPQSAFGDERD